MASASDSPLLWVALSSRSGYLRESRNLSASTGDTPAPISIENFHMLRDRQTADSVAAPDDKQARVNLLNWDGNGNEPGLFPPAERLAEEHLGKQNPGAYTDPGPADASDKGLGGAPL